MDKPLETRVCYACGHAYGICTEAGCAECHCGAFMDALASEPRLADAMREIERLKAINLTWAEERWPYQVGEDTPLRPVHWRRWAVMSPEGEPRRFCLTEGDADETACGDEDVQEVAIYPVDREVRVEASRERFPNLRAAFPIADEKERSKAMIALEGDAHVIAGGSARLIDEDRHGAPAHYNHDEVCAWIRGYNQAAAELRAIDATP